MPRDYQPEEPRGLRRQQSTHLIEPVCYARLFDTEDGQKVLAELERIFAAGAVVEGGIDAVIKTYHRAGARSVVEFIVRKINQANNALEPEEE